MKLYSRMITESFNLPKYLIMKRRNSLPTNLAALHTIELAVQSAKTKELLKQSLSMFKLRYENISVVLNDFMENKNTYFSLQQQQLLSYCHSLPSIQLFVVVGCYLFSYY